MADKTSQIFTVINAGKNKKPAIAIKGYVGGYRTNSDDLFKAINRMEEDNVEECDVLINSCGGSTIEGLTIGEYLEASPIKFNGIVVGMAASMAGVILQFCDTRNSFKYARLMTHKVKGGVHGESDQIRAFADLVDQEEVKIIDKFMQRTGQSKATVLSWMKSGVDFWMDAKMAKKNQLIDNILDNGKSIETKNNANLDELVNCFDENFTHAVSAYLPNKDFNTKTNMKQLIVAALGTAGLIEASTNVTDDAVVAVVNDLVEKANRCENAESELLNFKKTQATALVSNACKAGKITANEKQQWIDDAVENYALVSKSIDRMVGKVNPNNSLDRKFENPEDKDTPEIMKDRKDWTFNDWQDKDPEGLNNLSENHIEIFNQLFNAQYPS